MFFKTILKMNLKAKSIRTFIGAKDFSIARNFYKDLGYQESVISADLSYFELYESIGFYLQNAYVADWINNSMVFVEVEDVTDYYNNMLNLDLAAKYAGVRLLPIVKQTWGSEFFLHDPSGVLWHFGSFNL